MPPGIVLVGKDAEAALLRRKRRPGIHQFHVVVAVFAADVVDAARDHQPGSVDQGDLVAEFLDRLHVVGRKDDRRPFVLEAQDFLADQFRVDRVETGKRLVQDHQGRFMDDRRDELELLGHALGEFLDLLAPPVLDAELHEPFLQFDGGFARGHALELGEVHRLVPDLHLAVQAALFRQVADLGDIFIRDGTAVHQDGSRGGDGDPVDDADERGLARTVRPEEAEDLALRELQRHIRERHLFPEGLGYMLDFYHIVRIFATISTSSSPGPASPVSPPFPL